VAKSARARKGGRPPSRAKAALSEILGLVMLLGALFLFAAALTAGGSLRVPPVRTNLCGPVGEAVAVFLRRWIGLLGTWGLVGALAGAGVTLIGKKQFRLAAVRLFGVLLFVASLATLEEVTSRQGAPYEGPFRAGGFVGFALGDLALKHLNFFGTYVAVGVSLVVSIATMTDILIAPEESYTLPLLRWVLQAARSALSLLLRFLWKFACALNPLRLLRLAGKLRLPKKAETLKAASRKPAAAEAEDEEEIEEEEEEEEPEEEEEEYEYEEEEEEEEKREITIRVDSGRKTRTSRKGAGIRRRGGYVLPSIDLLALPDQSVNAPSREAVKAVARKIEETLQSFRIDGRVVEIQRGPVITQYEVLLAAGTKVHRITNLANELAMALKARSIRLVAPIPGKSTVGIEVPNPTREIVHLRELLESDVYQASRHEIPLLLGKDGAGNPIISDLTLMPHLLIAGATGSGKSVCLNSIIITVLMTRSPEEVKLILVDPKMVELSDFAEIPHLLCPVVTDMKKAAPTLAWLVGKMEERYEILAQVGVRNIVAFNKLGKDEILRRIEGKLTDVEIEKFPTFLPYIVLVVDELADLMMAAGKEVESHIIRLAQKSRAVGIHCVLATQRPSVDVITGLIKSNMPCRISFQVSSKVDSRTILDRNGAESLLGRGDMLFLPPGASDLRRVQCSYVSDADIRKVVKYVRAQAEAEFDEELNAGVKLSDESPSERDELYDEAVRIVLETQRGSATLLQRRLEIGYTRASRLIDMMAEEGIVGPFKGSKAREVYYTLEEWEEKKAKQRT